MKKLLLSLLILGTGATGFRSLYLAAQRERSARTGCAVLLRTEENRLAELKQAGALLRNEVNLKKRQLSQTAVHPRINPQLLALLDGTEAGKKSKAWPELREQLGIGWNSSPDYVLVHRRVLGRLNFDIIDANGGITDTAAILFSISDTARSEIEAAVQRCSAIVLAQAQRAQPSEDILAQYVFPANPDLELQLSNRFSAEVTGILGEQRADIFQERCWRALRADLPQTGEHALTMTIRRTISDGEPDLVWEIKEGDAATPLKMDEDQPGYFSHRAHYSQPIRYAHYPSAWFLTLFPGGWQDLADREGFQLPERYHEQR